MTKLTNLEKKLTEYGGLTSVSFTVNGTAAATGSNYPEEFYVAPMAMRIRAIAVRFKTASTSGTLDIKKAASGTAIGSATTVLGSTVSLAGTGDTTLYPAIASPVLAKGTVLGAVAAGTLTNQVTVTCTVFLEPLELNAG